MLAIAGPPVLNASAPASSMIMGPATPTSGRASPEVTLENIVEGSRFRQAPAVTEIDRQRLETLREEFDLDGRYAALEDEDLADTHIESEARLCLHAHLSDLDGLGIQLHHLLATR